MTQHARRGGIVIFSSQWPQHANRLAERAMVLHQGRLVHAVPLNQRIDKALIDSSEPALASVLSGLGSRA